jgi:hypothetical protein
MINVLNDAGYPRSLSSRLEALLTSYTGERSSQGTLQGMYPFDLLGNYYMSPIDRFLDDPRRAKSTIFMYSSRVWTLPMNFSENSFQPSAATISS